MSFGSGISWSNTHHRQGFWPRINCSQMKLPDFESPSGDSLSKSANFGLSKWIFYVKNHPNLSKKKFIEEYQFMRTVFDYSWFLTKNLSFAECPIMKFHYRNSSNTYQCLLIKFTVKYFSKLDIKHGTCSFYLVNIYFLEDKLAGSWKARFLAKIQHTHRKPR